MPQSFKVYRLERGADGQYGDPVAYEVGSAALAPLGAIVRVEFVSVIGRRPTFFALDTVAGASTLKASSVTGALDLSLRLALPGLGNDGSSPYVDFAWTIRWIGGAISIAKNKGNSGPGELLDTFLDQGKLPPIDLSEVNNNLAQLDADATPIAVKAMANPLGLWVNNDPPLDRPEIGLSIRKVKDAKNDYCLLTWTLSCVVGNLPTHCAYPTLAAVGPWAQPFLVVSRIPRGPGPDFGSALFTVIQSVEHALPGSFLVPTKAIGVAPAPYLVELSNLIPTVDPAHLPPQVPTAPPGVHALMTEGGATRVVNGMIQTPLDRALLTARNGHALSFVPQMKDAQLQANPSSAQLRYVLRVQMPANLNDAPVLDVTPGYFSSVDLSGVYQFEFGCVRTLENNSVRARAGVIRSASTGTKPWSISADAHRADPQWSFELDLSNVTWATPAGAANADPVNVRLGALDLQLDPTAASVGSSGWSVRAGGRGFCARLQGPVQRQRYQHGIAHAAIEALVGRIAAVGHAAWCCGSETQ